MYLIADEFLDAYKKELKDFDGDVTTFYDFGKKIDEYFNI
jgi:hypothetical protein